MYKKIFRSFYFLGFVLTLISTTAFRNWDTPEKRLTNYYESGQYYQEISAIIKEATYYLQFRLTQNNRSHEKQKLAIVMDIDETALSNYKKLKQASFYITPEIMQKIIVNSNNPAIPYTLALYNYAKEHGVDVFFITGRHYSTANNTVHNLTKAGYHEWKRISFNNSPVLQNTLSYRIAERHKIENEGYDIIMNIGNRSATLSGGHADMIFKLPNPFYQLT